MKELLVPVGHGSHKLSETLKKPGGHAKTNPNIHKSINFHIITYYHVSLYISNMYVISNIKQVFFPVMLPIDIMRYISSYLCLTDYYSASIAHRDFRSEYVHKRTRFEWCKKRAYVPRLGIGKCSNYSCSRQRLYCIELQHVHTRVLSMYCGPCTVIFKDIPSTVLLI